MESSGGTVTSLFTDIEGSTQLREQAPELMATALARHDEIVRGAVEFHGGRVFKAGGDAFCAAFASATDAVLGVLEAQRAVLPLAQDEALPIRVRMALYTGDAERRGEDYFGPPLNRCARILSAAHGGQVLVSATTAAITRDRLPESGALQPLGEHRLRDLVAPEGLYQFTHPDLPADFPPLRSLEAFPNNLPVQTTRLIGREKELRQVRVQLGRTRLLTLTGTGGAGRTRVALQVASDVLEDWPDGVWFVDLALLTDPSLVDHAVLAALGLHADPRSSPRETLLDSLRGQRVLLLLDNCEHLIEACAQLAEAVLTSCPDAAILATSREALRAAGETVWPVPSLSAPELGVEPLPPQSLGQYAAVQLFVERAAAARPGFAVTNSSSPAVAEICWRLDGIPLAIELAAARAHLLTPDEIARHLDDRFRLLTRGRRTAPPRHQTLRAAIEWSHDLLAAPEQTLFRRLSVLAGWFDLAAAEAVGAGGGTGGETVLDLLDDLVGKSLVLVSDDDQGARYRLLETLREYARERLAESGDETTTRARHAQYYLALAESEIADDLHQRARTQRAATHYSDPRAALEWFTTADHGFESGVRLAGALHTYWSTAGLFTEGRAHMARLLERPEASTLTNARADACRSAIWLAVGQEDYTGARALAEQALKLSRDLGDEEGTLRDLWHVAVVARLQRDHTAARALLEQLLLRQRERGDRAGIEYALGELALQAEWDLDGAKEEELRTELLSVERELGHRKEVAYSLGRLAELAHDRGDHERAQRLLKDALAELEEVHGSEAAAIGDPAIFSAVSRIRGDDSVLREIHEAKLAAARQTGDAQALKSALDSLRYLAEQRSDLGAAREYAEERVAVLRPLGDAGEMAEGLHGLGFVAEQQGDLDRARSAYEESLRMYREIGNRQKMGLGLACLARTSYRLGDDEAARAYTEESLAVCRDAGERHALHWALAILAQVAWDRGDYAESRSLQEERAAVLRLLPVNWKLTSCLRAIGAASRAMGQVEEARRALEDSMAVCGTLGDPDERGRALGALALAVSDGGDHAQARRLLSHPPENW